MKCALIGERLGHSYSKLIHEAFGLYSYELVSLPKDKVGEFMENEEFDAFNVTIPYKRTVMPYCSYISPEAQKIGSVNTVVRTSDGLHGFNTDYFGFKSMAERAGIDFAGKKVVILGSGGTSLTARAVASDGGAERITVVSRSGEYNYDNLEKLADCEVLINTTPVGMYPNNGCSAASLDKFPRCEAVLDVIYNPLRTQLIMQALERGIKCSGGLYMLVAQAAQSAKYFCSAEIGKEEIERVFRSLALDVQNIVLVGMPGCGKTTMLRDLIRQISNGNSYYEGQTVGVVDERSEIAACYNGRPQNDLGIRTDVLDCCPKAEGMVMLVRSMSPRVIAVDEIATPDDIEAVRYVMNCGCSIIATAHAYNADELRQKPQFAELLAMNVFKRIVTLGRSSGAGSIEEEVVL